MAGGPIDRDRLQALRLQEDRCYAERTKGSQALTARAAAVMPGGVPMGWMRGLFRTDPLYVSHGRGAQFFDVDGNAYLDFNVADLSMTMGFDAAPILEAVADQMAKGSQFMLPCENAVVVAEMLRERVGLPSWQFTLSASGANAEVFRIARFVSGRKKIVVFGGHYHGHLDDTLVVPGEAGAEPGMLGLLPEAAANTVILPFNDLEAVEQTLRAGDVALVVTEPVLTNCNLVQPDSGYLEALRRLTKTYGTLLAFDEAHSFQFAYGGLVGARELDCDFVTLGKGFGSGHAFALYGMSAEVAKVVAANIDSDVGPVGLATGGTLYGSALAAAIARAALSEVLTKEAYGRVSGLGTRLAQGLDELFTARDLPWRAFHLGPRSGFCLAPLLPRNIAEAQVSLDNDFIDARRVYLANRGIWEAVASAGPQAGFAHSEADIDLYLQTTDSFLDEVLR